MKTNILRMALPVAVIILGTAGAFGSHAMSQKASLEVTNETGWYHISPTDPCISSTMCSTAPGPVCTVNADPDAQQLYRKGSAATSCSFELNQPE